MTVIHIEIREHDGMFYATSEDLPGFLLCSKDQQTLDADMRPALEQLLAIKAEYHMEVAMT